MAKRKSKQNPEAVGTHPLFQVIRVTVRRSALDSIGMSEEEDEARNDTEIAAVVKVCDAHPDCVVQVYDREGRYLYTPQGEEGDAPILGDPDRAVRDRLEAGGYPGFPKVGG